MPSSLLEMMTTVNLSSTQEIANTILSKIPPNMITMKYAYDYIFTTIPIFDIHQAISPLFQHLFLALYDCFRTLCLLLFYCLLMVIKLLILAFPHALKLSKIVYEFHRTQLTTMDIIIEVLALTILLIVLVFRKRIMSWWLRVETYISAKSKAAAKAASHVVFFTTALIFAVLGKKFILPLTSSATMPIFTLLIPLISTIWWSRKYQTTGTVTAAGEDRRNEHDANSAPNGSLDIRENDKKMLQLAEKRLILWVILGIYHGIVTGLSLIPFSNKLLSYLPYLKEIIIVILIWVQLSPVFTDIVFASIISPVMTRLANYIPTTNSSRTIEEHAQQASALFTALKMMRILNDHQIRFLRAVFQDFVVSIMAIVFIFLPYPFSTIGMVTISLFLPAFRTVTVTNMIRHRLRSHRHAHHHDHDHGQRSRMSAGSGAGHDQNRVGEVVLMSLSSQWINYWICIGVFWLVKIYILDFWPSITIGAALWLQHSYFNGATVAIEGSYATFCVMMERNKAMQLERERERRERRDQMEREQGEQRRTRTEQGVTLTVDVLEETPVVANTQAHTRPLDEEYVTVSPTRSSGNDGENEGNDILSTIREVSESQRGTPITTEDDQSGNLTRRRVGGRSPDA